MNFFSRFVIAIIVCLLCRTVSSDEFEGNSYYCGIYSIHGAASALGIDSDFEKLISEKYVSSFKGSTIEDLKEASKLIGIKLEVYQGLGISSLESCKDPMLLHVASPGQLKSYNHWLLYLGTIDGQAQVLDSRNGVRFMSISKLCAQWDGIALVTYVGNQPNVDYRQVEIRSVMLLVLVGAAGIFCANSLLIFFQKKIRPHQLFALAVLLVAFPLALARDCVLWSDTANQFVFATVKEKSFEEITYSQLKKLLGRQEGEVLVFDARRKSAFHKGAIPSAANLPVDVSEAGLEEATKGYERDIEIVIYCRGARCGFDDVLAIRLAGLGFTNVKLYQAGFKEWFEKSKEDLDRHL